MNLCIWLTKAMQFFVLLPAAVFCYLPMKNQLKYSSRKLLLLDAVVFLLYTPAASWLVYYFNLEVNTVLLPSLVLFFILYYKTVKTDLARTLTVYLSACTLMTFPGIAAFIFDAWLHPESGALSFSLEAGCYQFVLSCVLVLLLAFPLRRYGSWMMDVLDFPKVWYTTLVLPVTLLSFNLMTTPYSYSTLHTGRILHLFSLLELLLLCLLMFLYVLFYHIAVVMLEHARQKEQILFLQMQAGQYEALQNHMQQTRRLRHDFRHLARSMAVLADGGELESLRAQLHEYCQELDVSMPENYCRNAALNALFHYYGEMASSEKIRTDWLLDIPDPLTISELDLCSLLGNLLENAIAGCRTVPEDQRTFSLSIVLKNTRCLYIVSANSFDGTVKKNKDGYLSTKRGGDGMGLFSIKTIAEKYNGVAYISNNSHEFFVNVMLKV